MTMVVPPMLRSRSAVSLVLLVGVVAGACAHDPRSAKAPPSKVDGPKGVVVGPTQYLVADPDGQAPTFAMVLGEGLLGAAIGRARVVMGRAEPKLAADEPAEPFAGVVRLPKRFGGGFLFWTKDDVFRADSFTGPLRPITHVPGVVSNISFAPKFILVHTENGERWAVGPDGARVAIEPIGVVDIEGLEDGRAIAMNDQGAIFTSVDGGAHWTDATSNVKSSPRQVSVLDDDVWLIESGNGGPTSGAHRLEPDGRLSFYDAAPTEKTVEVRPTDARWRGTEKPLRAVFHRGASIDESTAIVASGGDLVKVDVSTGEVVGILPGHLPPNATCEAVPVTNDVLFACQSHTGRLGSSTAFVVSHTLGSEAPVIEQQFAEAARFFASDDGGLAFEGPCAAGATPAPTATNLPVVCVRQPSGTWQEHDLSMFASDAGTPTPALSVARFVPRADGRAVAITLDPTPAILDLRTGSMTPIQAGGRDLGLHARGHGRKYYGTVVVDGGWTFTAQNALRAWDRQGHPIEVSEDGRLTVSPWDLQIEAAGANGIGKSKDGRMYQSLDHGATWTEVAPPPSGGGAVEPRACSSAGCDLGGFYRVGWAARPPQAIAARTVARPPPEVRREPAIELACRPLGPPVSKVLPRTDRSPDDLGLGATRIGPVSTKDDHQLVHEPIMRAFVNPVHPMSTDGEVDTSLRVLLGGYGTEPGGDTFVVAGPDKSAARLKRLVSFVVPLDPAATVRRSTLAMSDIIQAGRAAGMSQEEILGEDLSLLTAVTVVTPLDPLAPSDLVAQQGAQGLVVWLRENGRVRVAMHANPRENVSVVSGAAVSNDELALLEVESNGVGHVFKTSGSTTSELFDLSPTLADAEYYPANPDAVAIGPKNEIGVLRTPSGSDPASARDPAFVFLPATPPMRLAPWSTLKLASDPECKRDPGWRATIQTVAPWLRTTAPEHRVLDIPMLARVKWNEKRVCLEGFEVRLPGVDLRIKSPAGGLDTEPLSTWLVGLVGKTTSFARIGVSEGNEWRQPLECALRP